MSLIRPLTEEERVFLTSWLAWVDAGAPEGEPFTRRNGLCHNAHWYSLSAIRWSLNDLLDRDFPYEPFPFGGLWVSLDESRQENAHLNAARVAWVREKLK